MVSKRDLSFISMEYENYELPKEKLYLYKYFRKNIQQMFLKYFFCFGDFNNFVDHTGYYCQKRWLIILQKKLLKLESAHKEAKLNLNFSTLTAIERGKYKLT